MKKSTRFYVVGSSTVRCRSFLDGNTGDSRLKDNSISMCSYWFCSARFAENAASTVGTFFFFVFVLRWHDFCFNELIKHNAQPTNDIFSEFNGTPFRTNFVCSQQTSTANISVSIIIPFHILQSSDLSVCFRSIYILLSYACNSGANLILPDNIYRSHRWSGWF